MRVETSNNRVFFLYFMGLWFLGGNVDEVMRMNDLFLFFSFNFFLILHVLFFLKEKLNYLGSGGGEIRALNHMYET